MTRVWNRSFVASFVALLGATSFLIAGCGAAEDGAAEKTSVQEISHQDLLTKLPQGALILDVRTAGEFGDGHVPNAVNISHDELASRLTELNSATDRPIVLYCHSGRRAGVAATVLQGAGYTDLYHLTGDMQGWTAAGLPTE